ncbi:MULTISPECIES: ABC transporter substrate-binding protein [unclassified Paracoccus (in: a-proteobacteria)]|uniref:ABC transporter substrate-binding protein n=1 Tax=unclassified Paracoccus (in: a-proteobacteria) TaxID=2688777 RepID=UPI001603CC38|nr:MULTISPECIES: ABC transporter substrate-binding protein [unclassified Paracoccus (in: a-proteobacteria)]MBB1492674.1 ABC transporter substrate-binding protein [Paracoccus sp. MC1854]MBB1499197.1 ABC transporter substrate-binding protein [Paracoccus sp. MC1862]QQO45012.1 ABC transporter substrate-binding protein [Paracoccus sp. MC1862]
MKHLLTAALMVLATPALAQDRLTLMLDWFVNPDHAPIVIAQERGFFTDAGLEVEIVSPADPADPPKLVAAGRADLGISYQPQLHLQVHEGLPLRRVGTLIGMPLNCLMVRADGPVQEVTDLKGRKIGYSVAGVEQALVSALLATEGMTLDDVEMVNVNWALTSALLSGQVDATIGSYRNFEVTQMRLAGGEGRCLFLEEEGLPAYDELIFLANPERMDLDRVNRFLSALERGTQFMLNHPEEAREIFADHAPDLSDELNTQAWEDTFGRFSLSPAALDHGRYRRFEQFLLDAGLIDEVWPVERLALDPGTAE